MSSTATSGHGPVSGSARLPWPEEWRARPHWQFWPACAFLGLFALFGFGLSIAGVRQGDGGAPLVGGGFALIFALVVAVFARRMLPYLRGGGADGVLIRPGPVLHIRHSAAHSLAGLIASVAVLFLLVVHAGAVVLLVAGGTDEVSAPVVAGVLVGVLGVAIVAGRLVCRRRGRAGLEIGPKGVSRRGWILSESVDWEHVTRVSAWEDPGLWNSRGPVVRLHTRRVAGQPRPVRRSSPGLGREKRLARSSPGAVLELDIAVSALAVSPPVVFWLLRFYHLNPGARAELGTDGALRRVARGAAGFPSDVP